jgi:hypothetical protein
MNEELIANQMNIYYLFKFIFNLISVIRKMYGKIVRRQTLNFGRFLIKIRSSCFGY